MYLSPHESKLLECSIFHYFVWQQEANPANAKHDDTTAVDTNDNSLLCSNHLPNTYNRIIKVLIEELPHVAAMSETPTLYSSTPEICFRWIKYATMRNILLNTEIPRNAKRKRDMADETANLTKALKSIPDDEITLENAKEVMSTLREEHAEVKKITDSLELKLSKSEKIYSGLLKIHKEKLRLEKRLTNFECEEAKTEQTFDNQHVNEIEEGEGDQHTLREKLETKKRRVELQETMYANAILYEVHETEQTKEAKTISRQMNFESRLQQLIEFKQEFGHCQVGWDYNRALYRWLVRQRRYYRWKKLSSERIAKLDALGMVWDYDICNKRTFDVYLEMCQDFKEAHGHLRIPLLAELNEDGAELTEDDVRFRIWAQSMRKQYQITASGKTGLDRHCITILDSLGFQWILDATSAEGGNIDVESQTPRDSMFRTRIEQLRKVKEICGNCNEKKHIFSVFPNNNSLYYWAKHQRTHMKLWLAGKRSKLNEERIEMLRSVEFDHDPRKHYTPPPPSSKKKWLTKMEKIALKLYEKKNNQDPDDASEYDNSDMDQELQTNA